MKKSIFVAVLGVGVAVAAHAQGNIHFSNYLTGPSDPKVVYGSVAQGVPAGLAGLSVGSEVMAQLAYYVGTSVADVPTSLDQMTLLSFSNGGNQSPVPFGLAGGDAAGSSYAGWFDGGTVNIPGISSANASFVSFEILAFNGATYASSALSGHSVIFQSPVSATSTSGTPNFLSGAWQNFTVTAVPEPSSLALAGLGGFGMLMAFRRKKS